MTKIKICGLFREADMDFANEAGPDFTGFVFAESRRRVSPVQAARLRSRLREGIIPVGVFVDAPAEEIAALYRDGLIGMAQLHGGEDAAYIRRLKTLSASGGAAPVPVIKVLRIGGGPETAGGGCFSEEREELGVREKLGVRSEERSVEAADYVLFDSGSGSGKSFDWSLLGALLFSEETEAPDWGVAEDLLRAAGPPQVFRSFAEQNSTSGRSKAGARGGQGKFFRGEKKSGKCPPLLNKSSLPWFLAGGVDCNNIEKALALRPFGIDVSSGAETGGVKDREKMIALVRRVREAL